MNALRFHPRLRFRRSFAQRLCDFRVTVRNGEAAGFWRTLWRSIVEADTEDFV